MSKTTTIMDLGDLAPVRDVSAWLAERIDADRALRAEDDPALLAMREMRKRLDEALAAAANADLEIEVEEAARLEGVTADAIYKRIQRGREPRVRRRGGRVRIALTRAA